MFAVTVMIVLIFLTANAFSAELTLVWGSNGASHSAGYRIYYGTCSGIYTSCVDAGQVDHFTISDLVAGQIYYFAVTAYNDRGQDGHFSKEVAYRPSEEKAVAGTVPMRLKIIPMVPAPLVLTSNKL
jgi:hypothetical protein